MHGNMNLPRSLASQSGPGGARFYSWMKKRTEKVRGNTINTKLEKNLFLSQAVTCSCLSKSKPALEQRILFPNTWVSWNTFTDESGLTPCGPANLKNTILWEWLRGELTVSNIISCYNQSQLFISDYVLRKRFSILPLTTVMPSHGFRRFMEPFLILSLQETRVPFCPFSLSILPGNHLPGISNLLNLTQWNLGTVSQGRSINNSIAKHTY